MKHIFLLILFLGLSQRVLMGQSNWKTYEQKEYNFSIDFPAQPIFSVDSLSFNDSLQLSHDWILELEGDSNINSFYSINRIVYPSSFIHSDSSNQVVEGFINSTQNSLIDDPTVTLISSNLIEKNGYLGKVFKWKSNQNQIFFWFQVFLIQNQLYQMSVVAGQKDSHNGEINQFFDSFKLIDIEKGNYVLPAKTLKRSYSISFKDTPKLETKYLDSEAGKLEIEIQMLERKVEDDVRVYVAMETIYPDNAVNISNSYDLDLLYKNASTGSLNSTNGVLISYSDINFFNYPGKEMKFYIYEGKFVMIYRYFLIDNHLYSFGVMASPEKTKSDEIKLFFNSFKLLNN